MKISFWFLNENRLSFHLKILDSFSNEGENGGNQESDRDGLWNSKLPFPQGTWRNLYPGLSTEEDSIPASKLLIYKWLKKKLLCHLLTVPQVWIHAASSSFLLTYYLFFNGKEWVVWYHVFSFFLSSNICSKLGDGGEEGWSDQKKQQSNSE